MEIVRWATSSAPFAGNSTRSEEHTSELQSQSNLVCRLLLEKKKKQYYSHLLSPPVQLRFVLDLDNIPTAPHGLYIHVRSPSASRTRTPPTHTGPRDSASSDV